MKISDDFLTVIGGLLELYGQQASKTKVNIYWSVLGRYPISSLRSAANAWVRKSEFMPKPADLIKMIGGINNHLSGDEAWAIAILASDEENTVVWTNEMAKAWSLAEIVYQNGDHIGARRTFIEAYERAINEALMYGKPVEVFVSLGRNKEKRIDAINRAIFTGLLTQDKANNYLPKPENTIAMLELNIKHNNSTNNTMYLTKIKKMLKAKQTSANAF